MKTKDFIRRVEELGYDVKLRNDYIQIIHDEFVAVVVYVNVMYSITFHQIIKTSWNNGDKLFDLIVEYVKTPIKDREEEKKFYLRHKFLKSSLGEIAREDSVVNYNIRDNVLYLADKQPVGYIKTFFTLKEIEEIKEKLDTDLADFDLVEVEDDY